MRGVRYFKVRVKLAPRFIGPFKIMDEREGEVKAEFPNFFSHPSKSQGKIHLWEVGLSHPKIRNLGCD
jgi:hypothetical protein